MAAGQRVLIIADDSRVAELYASKLRRGGYDVNVAPDAISGFDLAGPLPPDAIILDIRLPRLSGLAAVAALRKDEATSSVPVIVLSNDDAPAVLEEAGRLGVSAYLIKSIEMPRDVAEALSDLWHDPAEMTESPWSTVATMPHETMPEDVAAGEGHPLYRRHYQRGRGETGGMRPVFPDDQCPLRPTGRRRAPLRLVERS